MKSSLIAVLAVAGCFAQSAAQPACNAHSRGAVWPDAGTRAPGVEVQVCSWSGWRYRWKPVTVDLNRLRNERRLPAAVPPERLPVPPPSPVSADHQR